MYDTLAEYAKQFETTTNKYIYNWIEIAKHTITSINFKNAE